MKQILFPMVIVLSLIIIQNVHAQEKIRITNGEWLPYHSENLPHYGAGSRIVTEAFALEGVDVEWGFFPWKRSYKNVVIGQWDASIGWIRNPEREKEVLFSDPVYGGDQVFFHLKSNPFDWKTIEDLKGIKIGAMLGYSYGDLFDSAEKNGIIDVERLSKEVMNFKKLITGRIPLFAHAKDSGYETLRKNFKPDEVQQVTHHSHPVQVVNYCLVIAKNEKNKPLLEKFNRGLKKLKESGEVDKYLKEAWEQ